MAKPTCLDLPGPRRHPRRGEAPPHAPAAAIASRLFQRTIDIGMVGNGAIAGLVGITAPSGYVEFWAAPIIGLVAGVIGVVGVLAIDKKLDDPVGALSAHGLAGVWGTVSAGLFTSPRLAELNGVGEGGLFYTGSFAQLGAQALGVLVAFVVVFAVFVRGVLRDQEDDRACDGEPRP